MVQTEYVSRHLGDVAHLVSDQAVALCDDFVSCDACHFEDSFKVKRGISLGAVVCDFASANSLTDFHRFRSPFRVRLQNRVNKKGPQCH